MQYGELFSVSGLRSIHSSDMSIIQKFLTNQIATNEIIIVVTPYCPTPQHLLHMQKRDEFTKFEDFWSIKMSWMPKFSLKLLSDTLQWCEMMHK